MDDLHGDRAQKQALNTTEASRSHHDMLDAFVASCLRDRFRRLSGSDDVLKSNSGRLSFSNRLFKGLSRCLRSCVLPIVSRCSTSQVHGANVLHIEQHKRSIWILTRHFDREVERAKRRRRTVDRDQNL